MKSPNVYGRMKKTVLALFSLLLLAAPMAEAQFGVSTNADGTLTITNYTGPVGPVTIPTNVNGVTVIGIAGFAFEYSTNITSVTIPEGISNVGPYSFQYSPTLTNVMVLGTAYIGSNAFWNCTNLRSAFIAGGTLGYGAFQSCDNEAGFPPYPNQPPPIGLTNVILGNGVTSIGDWVFSSDLFSNVVIPENVTNIGDYALSECPLGSIVLPWGVVSIGLGAFEDCPLTNVTFPSGLQSIGPFAFYGTLLRSVTFPDNVTSIGASSFYGCGDLASNIIIPASVTQLAAAAFAYDPATNLLFLGNPPTLTEDQGPDLLNYGSGTETAYYLQGTTGWSNTFAGMRAVLWNPTIESAGVTNGQFGFNITGTANIPIVVEACTNLANPVWMPLQSMTLTNGVVYFSDPNWTNYSDRYYGIGFP